MSRPVLKIGIVVGMVLAILATLVWHGSTSGQLTAEEEQLLGMWHLTEKSWSGSHGELYYVLYRDRSIYTIATDSSGREDTKQIGTWHIKDGSIIYRNPVPDNASFFDQLTDPYYRPDKSYTMLTINSVDGDSISFSQYWHDRRGELKAAPQTCIWKRVTHPEVP